MSIQQVMDLVTAIVSLLSASISAFAAGISAVVAFLTSCLTCITVLATGGLVFFAAEQLRKFVAQMQNETYRNVCELELEIDKVFLAQPELRPYFYEGEKVPEFAEPRLRGKIRSAAELLTDIFDTALTQKAYMPLWESQWDDFIVFVYKNSPEMNAYLDEHPSWYCERLKNLACHARQVGDKEQ